MPTARSSLDLAERTPAWDLRMLRIHLMRVVNCSPPGGLSPADEQRFNELCRCYQERLRRLMPAA
jgi:hypothetical protein